MMITLYLTAIFSALFIGANADCASYGDQCVPCYSDQGCGGCYGTQGWLGGGPLECIPRSGYTCEDPVWVANRVTSCKTMCTEPGESDACEAAFCALHRDCAPCLGDVTCGGCYDSGDLVCMSKTEAGAGSCTDFKTAENLLTNGFSLLQKLK
eukprot:GHVO01064250.1.p1 GENE.GHVO01064250.1~~GHVO01064250.1.p1  ORF type:complete len:153 (+),score=4.19 GHVO01064250.1:86-544(+)